MAMLNNQRVVNGSSGTQTTSLVIRHRRVPSLRGVYCRARCVGISCAPTGRCAASAATSGHVIKGYVCLLVTPENLVS